MYQDIDADPRRYNNLTEFVYWSMVQPTTTLHGVEKPEVRREPHR